MSMVEFFKQGNYSYSSDCRDIRTRSGIGEEILQWCEDNNVQASKVMYGNLIPYNIWSVRDDQQRIIFKLRWEQ